MDLGTFSMSLAVSDLQASRSFYQALGFEMVAAEGQGGVWDSYGETWAMMKHLRSDGSEIKIGLFQGMFEANTLTFNPGNVRAVQRRLRRAGIDLVMEADEDTTGPAAIMLLDPDGNPVLLDQQ